MTNTHCHIEYCTNDEWIAAALCDEFELPEYLKDAALTYVETAVSFAEDCGLEVHRARGQRMLFHGWNGAHFDERHGIFGVHGTRELSELEAHQLAITLFKADSAGYEAARKLLTEAQNARAKNAG